MLKHILEHNLSILAAEFAASLQSDEAREGYNLLFVGRDYAKLQAARLSETLITPDSEWNAKPENANSQNVFITGDNLEALRHLQHAYREKVKVIYIDPPYNTGKEFVYADHFELSDDELQKYGYDEKQIDRLKSLQGKSSHSAWLTFMYPRLKLAQKLLRPDGVIFVSIDDNEQAQLKLLMDDIFGEGNFVNKVIWVRNRSGKTVIKQLLVNIEYLYIYSKSNSYTLNTIYQPLSEATIRMYSKNDNDGRGKYRLYPMQKTSSPGPETTYDYVDNNGKIWKCPLKGWRMIESKVRALENDGRLCLENDTLSEKAYWNERESDGRLADTLWDDMPENSVGNKEVSDFFNRTEIFTNPKPVDYIKRMLQMSCTPLDSGNTGKIDKRGGGGTSSQNERDIILDFFAGSGTTAHAVMQLNAEDGGDRKFIMVQLDEPVNETSEAKKNGYQTIDEISRERIKRAAVKIRKECSADLLADRELDLGFKHYRLTTLPDETLDKIIDFKPVEHLIKPLQTDNETILQTWLIDDGYDFNVNIETLHLAQQYEAYYIAEGGAVYLINEEWTTDALKDLLNRIGRDKLPVSTVILYGYAFGFTQLRELKTNLKNNLEASVNIIERF